MAPRRAKSGKSDWTGAQRDASLNGMFEAMQIKAQNDLGGEISIGSQAEENLVGLPIPALCLRYLFQSTVLPLSRMLQIVGEEGSAKSSFLYEIMRWHAMFGGGTVLAENENKDSPELRHSLLEWREDWLNRVIVKPTYSLEEWQDVFSSFIDYAIEAQEKQGGSGRTVPIVFAVDSIMATAPQSEIDAVNKDGHSSRGYALAANLVARYMRVLPSKIKNYPFTVIGTNHLKPGTDARGLPTSTTPGGKSVKFMETYEIEMKRAQNCDIDVQEYSGLRIKFIARKNSLGPSRKTITAELLWWNRQCEDGMWRQHTIWDWDTASIDLLVAFENTKGKKTLYNKICEVTGLKVVSKSLRTAYSTVLGVPASAPVSFRRIGELLEQRPDVLTELYPLIGIMQRKEFKAGTDYREVVNQAVGEVRAREAYRYANVEDLPVIAAPEGDMETEVEAEDNDSE